MNPLQLGYLAKCYVTDVHRLEKDLQDLDRYREKAFQRVLKRAMQTPLYREKYRGIDIEAITLDTIDHLPILTKQDIRQHFPQGVVPEGYNTKRALVVSTSGSTGQPTSIYTDFFTVIKALMGFIREIREYGISWRRDKMTIIADLTTGSAEEAYLNQTAVPNLKAFFSMNNMQLIHVGGDMMDIIEKIDAFKPKFIGGYPGSLQALAVLKRKGHGLHIQPEIIASSGAVLDDYTRRYIEEAFGARVFDVYGSTEAGPIAFECQKGKYHTHYDMVHLEFLDEHETPVPFGIPGRIVITKLYGNATPIIRYNGLNDFVIPLADHCDCGIHSPLIAQVAGRMVDVLIMPSGRIIEPFSVSGIPAKVMERAGSSIIQQFQIVQEDYDTVDVFLVMDATSDGKEKIKREIEKEFEKKLERNVKVHVKEVSMIKNETAIPRVIKSKVKRL